MTTSYSPEDARGGWAYCADCGRVIHVSRYGTYDEHTVALDLDDRCSSSGRVVSDGRAR